MKSSQAKPPERVSLDSSSLSTECFITKNSSRFSWSSVPRIRFQTLNASRVRPLCMRKRGDSGMKNMPANMMVENTSEEPSI